MDIRTKLIFTFVAVALASMAALAYTTYTTVGSQLRVTRIDQLEGLAEFKVRSLTSIVESWEEQMSLVASRDRLRSNLAGWRETQDSTELEQLQEVLRNVRRASPTFHQVAVHGPTGARIAWAGPEPGHPQADLDLVERGDQQRPWFIGVVFPDGGEMPLASMAAPIELGEERVGYLHALLSMAEIIQISTNYEGLGESGETMVTASDDGTPRVLHPVRAAPVPGDTTLDAQRFQGPGLRVQPDDPAALSLQDAELTFDGGVTDYRGQEVWVSTEYLPETGWGVLVKVDAWEQEMPRLTIRSELVNIMVILAAFAILAGAVIGYRVAQPIHLLSEAANRIREGDLSARTGIQREDEVGLLAQTFDKMGAELEEQVKLLTEYQMFFDWSLDMMCIAATDGYFKRVNAAWTRELGWTQEELLSRPFVSFVHPDDVDKTIAEVAKLDEGIPTIHFENRYLAKDGSYKTLRWRSSPEQGTGRLYAIARVITPGTPDFEVAPTFPEEGPLPTPGSQAASASPAPRDDEPGAGRGGQTGGDRGESGGDRRGEGRESRRGEPTDQGGSS